MRYFSMLIVILFIVTGCKHHKQTLEEKRRKLEAGKLDDKSVYTADQVGWTIQLPPDWDMKSGIKVANPKLIQLVTIEKDRFSRFQATIEPWDETKGVSYIFYNEIAFQILVKMNLSQNKAYYSPKMRFHYSRGSATFNGLSFDKFDYRIDSPDGTETIMNLRMYSRLINGYNFVMSTVFNSGADEYKLYNMM